MLEGFWTEKRRIVLVVVASICLLMLPAAPARAVRVFTLTGTDSAPEQAHGAVRFRWLYDPDHDIHRIKMRFNADNLPRRHGRVYCLWLVDGQSDQKFLLGAFDTDRDDRAEFSEVFQISTFDYFDGLIVTSEPQNDMSPGPDGPVVLEGMSPDQSRGSE